MKTKLIFLYCAAFVFCSVKAQSPETIMRTVKNAYGNSYYSNPNYGSYYGSYYDESQPRRSSTVRKSPVSSSSQQYYYYSAEEDPERIMQVVKNAYAKDYDSYGFWYDGSDYYQPVKTYQQPVGTYYYQQPVGTYYQQQPVKSYQPPADIYYQPPAGTYYQPADVYYQQPVDIYQQPVKSYQQPATVYQQSVETVPQTRDQLNLSLQTPKLTQIPDYVFNMRGLKILDVGYNRIGTISRQILNLSQLEVLILSGNQYLNELPDFLGEMKNLRTVYLQGMGTWNDQKKYATVNRFKSKGIMVVTD